MTTRLRLLLKRHGGDPRKTLSYIEEFNIYLPRSDMKHLEMMIEGEL